MMAPNDGSKGFPPANIGEVVNRGFEIDLGYNGLVNKFRYYIRGNLSFARNKVVECGESPVTYPWLSKVGRPIGQRFGLIADGFYNTEEEIDALPSGFTDRPKLETSNTATSTATARPTTTMSMYPSDAPRYPKSSMDSP
ncbi:MAG: hypothetical protein ACLVK4_16115 [Alistipes shahii]|uniref:hypothetical protein n=1 Tax=Alistipes shahii TaxID=328814 RepID=UPI00399C92D1